MLIKKFAAVKEQILFLYFQVNSEFYTGWLDHWGDKHAHVDSKVVADTLDKMLALNASVNMYMFEGVFLFKLYIHA